MGNRAVITANKAKDVATSDDIGVYLHWNGGRDSVEAFLKYCKLQGYRSPETDSYGYARLCQVIANFFGGSLSVGIEKCCTLDCDNWDNGVYIIEDWEIVGRQYFEGHEQDSYDLNEMLLDIDSCMPAKLQLGKKFLQAPIVPTNELQIGDKVFIQEYGETYKAYEIVGIGEDKMVNGSNVKGVPFVANYSNDGDYSWNINNYLFKEEYRISE